MDETDQLAPERENRRLLHEKSLLPSRDGLRARCDLAHRRQIDREFRFTVHTKQRIRRLLVIRGHGTRTGANAFAGQVEILADVTGIQGNDLITGLAVSPLHAFGHGGPKKRDRSPADEPLSQGCPHHPRLQVLRPPHRQERVVQRQIAVESRSKAHHPENGQVRFQRMAATGRRDGTGDHRRIHDLMYPLCRPKQKRQLRQRKRLLLKSPS